MAKYYKIRSKQVARDLIELGISTRNANRIEREAKSHAARALIELIELLNEKGLTVKFLRDANTEYNGEDVVFLKRREGRRLKEADFWTHYR